MSFAGTPQRTQSLGGGSRPGSAAGSPKARFTTSLPTNVNPKFNALLGLDQQLAVTNETKEFDEDFIAACKIMESGTDIDVDEDSAMLSSPIMRKAASSRGLQRSGSMIATMNTFSNAAAGTLNRSMSMGGSFGLGNSSRNFVDPGSPTSPNRNKGPKPGKYLSEDLGLDNYGVTQDHYNGTMQAFTQLPVLALHKTNTWERFISSRNQMVDDCGEIAVAAFIVSCLEPSDDRFIEILPPDARGTPENPVTRMQLESMFRVVGGSLLYLPKALFIHVWNDSIAARSYARRMERCWDVIYSHRIDGVHVPVAINYSIEGVDISVTAIPPVYVERVNPITDPLTGSADTASILMTMARRMQMMAAVDSESMQFYHGIDGRAYLLTPRSKNLDAYGVQRPFRIQLHKLYQRERMKEDATEPTRQDLLNFMDTFCIPRVAIGLVEVAGSTPGITVEQIIGETIIPAVFHSHGVNICYSFRVFAKIHELQLSHIDAEQPAPFPSEWEGLSKEVIKAAMGVCKHALIVEMVGRSIKELLKADMNASSGSATIGSRNFGLTGRKCTTLAMRMDVVNRIGRWTIGRSPEFLAFNVVPLMKIKFGVGDAFNNLTWDNIPPGTCMKLISLRVGCLFSPQAGKFNEFADISSKRALMFGVPLYVDSMLKRNDVSTQRSVAELWGIVDAIGKSSPLFRPNLLAAMVASLITGCLTGRLRGYRTLPNTFSTLEKLEFTTMIATFDITTSNSPQESVSNVVQLLADLADEQGSEVRPFGIDFGDALVLSVKLLQTASMMENAKIPHDLAIYTRAMQDYLSSSHVDFVFSSSHSQALRDLESLLPVMKPHEIEQFIDTIIDPVQELLKRWNRLPNAARLTVRVLLKMVAVPSAETANFSARLATTAFSNHMTAHGTFDFRTNLALYCLIYFGITSARPTSRSNAQITLIGNLKKVIDKANQLPPSMQLSLAYTPQVFKLLQRGLAMLKELEMTGIAQTLTPRINAMATFVEDLCVLQAACRGFQVRKYVKGVSSNKQKDSKFIRPSTPSYSRPQGSTLGFSPFVRPSDPDRMDSPKSEPAKTPSDDNLSFGSNNNSGQEKPTASPKAGKPPIARPPAPSDAARPSETNFDSDEEVELAPPPKTEEPPPPPPPAAETPPENVSTGNASAANDAPATEPEPATAEPTPKGPSKERLAGAKAELAAMDDNVREIFLLCDVNERGVLDPQEAVDVLKELGVAPDDEIEDVVFGIAADSPDGFITPAEFSEFTTEFGWV